MTQARYLTPRLGRRSASILGILLAAAIGLGAGYATSARRGVRIEAPESYAYFILLVGLMGISYGLAVGASWMATLISAPYLRWVVRLAVVVLATLAQQSLRTESLLRDLTSVGGLVFSQCLIFAWLRIPGWRSANDGETERERSLQFGVGDVLIATTCVALLLAAATRYAPPIDSARYWLVLCAVWVVAPLVAAMVTRCVLSVRFVGSGLGYLISATLLAGLWISGLTVAELSIPAPSFLRSAAITAGLYGSMVIGFCVVQSIVALSGRVQADRYDE